jgi:hypothetical protein
METNDSMSRREWIQIVFNLLLVVTLCALIVTTVTLLKNKDLIVKDPLDYGMKVHNFTSCSCLDSQNKQWDSKDGGFIHIEQGEIIEYKLPKLNFSGGN